MSNDLLLNGCFSKGLSFWLGSDFSVITDPVEGCYAHHENIDATLTQILERSNTIKKNEHYQLIIKARAVKVEEMKPILLVTAGTQYNIPCDNPNSHQLNSNWEEFKFNFSIGDIESEVTDVRLIMNNFSDITNISLVKL